MHTADTGTQSNVTRNVAAFKLYISLAITPFSKHSWQVIEAAPNQIAESAVAELVVQSLLIVAKLWIGRLASKVWRADAVYARFDSPVRWSKESRYYATHEEK